MMINECGAVGRMRIGRGNRRDPLKYPQRSPKCLEKCIIHIFLYTDVGVADYQLHVVSIFGVP
jgi:hypothetical protein